MCNDIIYYYNSFVNIIKELLIIPELTEYKYDLATDLICDPDI